MSENYKKYINKNKMLLEIRNSKRTYCWLKDNNKTYMDFDVFVNNLEDINQELIDLGKISRAKKKSKEILENELSINKNNPIELKKILKNKSEYKIDENQIQNGEVIIRYNTNEHIPMGYSKSGKRIKHKTNFPPFKHYILLNGELIEVVRSHWKGSLENGVFSTKHGKLTDELGKIIMALAEKYSSRYNFREYSYRDEMVDDAILQLCSVALKFNETVTDNPHAFYSKITKNAFRVVLNSEKRVRNIRDDLIEMNGSTPSLNRQTNLDEIENAATFFNEIDKSYNNSENDNENVD